MTEHTPAGRPAEELGYAEALAELEAILAELERDAVDVDRLGAQVARAAELLAVLRSRIGAAKVRIEQVVASLDTTP